jgi:ABC-type lipoprotein export system ATPase subunit
VSSLVRATGLYKRYISGETSHCAVSGVSLSIEQGEFVAIRGRSGSGKSTLMHVLGLLERPDSGHYALLGQEVADLSEDARALIRNREIGFVFQWPALLPACRCGRYRVASSRADDSAWTHLERTAKLTLQVSEQKSWSAAFAGKLFNISSHAPIA